MSHLFPSAKGDQLCPLGFHPQVRWPTRCKRCFRDYKEHGNKRNGEDITASTPVLPGSSHSRSRDGGSSSSLDKPVRSWTSTQNLFVSHNSNSNGSSSDRPPGLPQRPASWASTPDLDNILQQVKADFTVNLTLPRRRHTTTFDNFDEPETTVTLKRPPLPPILRVEPKKDDAKTELEKAEDQGVVIEKGDSLAERVRKMNLIKRQGSVERDSRERSVPTREEEEPKPVLKPIKTVEPEKVERKRRVRPIPESTVEEPASKPQLTLSKTTITSTKPLGSTTLAPLKEKEPKKLTTTSSAEPAKDSTKIIRRRKVDTGPFESSSKPTTTFTPKPTITPAPILKPVAAPTPKPDPIINNSSDDVKFLISIKDNKSKRDDDLHSFTTETTETTIVDHTDNHELQEEIESLKRELETVKARCDRAEREKSDILLRRLASMDTGSNKTAASEALKLQQKVNEQKQMLEDLQDEKKFLTAKVKELESDVKIRGTKNVEEQLRQKLEQAETLCEELMDENEEIKRELRNMESEIEEMHDNFREDQADEYASLKKELDQTTKNCRILSFKLKKSDRKIEQLETEKAALGASTDLAVKVKQLEDELKVANEVARRLQGELEQIESNPTTPTKKTPSLGKIGKSTSADNKFSRASLTRGGSQEDPVQLLRDLQDSLEREADLREQLKYAEEEAENLRRKSGRVEDDNESLMMQLKKMATKARTKGIFNTGRKLSPSPPNRRLTPEGPMEKDEGISDEDDPAELRLQLELNEQETAVLRRKIEELEIENKRSREHVKELQESLISKTKEMDKQNKFPSLLGSKGSGTKDPLDEKKIKVMEDQISELRMKLIEKDREVERVQAELSVSKTKGGKSLVKSKSLDADQQVLDLKRQLQVIEQEANVLRQKTQTLEQENEKYNAEIKQLQQTKAKGSEVETKKLNSTIQELQKEKSELESRLKRVMVESSVSLPSRSPKTTNDMHTKLQLKRMVEESENEINELRAIVGRSGAMNITTLENEKKKLLADLAESKEQRSKLEAEIRKLAAPKVSSELQAIKLSEAQRTVQKLEDENKKQNDKIKVLEEKISKITTTMKTAESTKTQLETQLNSEKDKLSVAQRDLDGLRKDKSTIERKISDLENKLLEERQQAADIKEHLEREITNLKRKSMSNDPSALRIQELSVKNDEMMIKLEDETKKYQQLVSKHETLEEDHVMLKAQMETEKQKLQELDVLRSKLTQADNIEARLVKENTNLSRKCVEMQKKIAALESAADSRLAGLELEKNRLKSSLEDKQREYEHLCEENEMNAYQVGQLRKDNDDLRGKLDDYERINKAQRTLSEHNSHLEQELKKLHLQLETAEMNVKSEVAATRLRYEQQVTNLHNELTGLQRQCERFKRDRDTFKQLVEAAQKQIGDMKANRRSLASVTSSSGDDDDKSKIIALEQQIGCLEDELSEARLEASKVRTELISELSASEIKISEMQSKINELEEEKIISGGKSKVPGTKTRLELSWQKEREDLQRLVQETSTLARDLRQTLFEVERERDKEKLESKRKIDQIKKTTEEEIEEGRRKVTELQSDLLELRDAHAKLRTANEKLRRDRERSEREREGATRRRLEVEGDRRMGALLQTVDELMKLAPELQRASSRQEPTTTTTSTGKTISANAPIPTPPMRHKSPSPGPGGATPQSPTVTAVLSRLAEASDDLRRYQRMCDEEKDRERMRRGGMRRAASQENDSIEGHTGRPVMRISRNGGSLYKKSLSLDQSLQIEQQGQLIWKEGDDSMSSLQSLDSEYGARYQRDSSLDSRLSGGSTQSDMPRMRKKKRGLMGKLRSLSLTRGSKGSESDFSIQGSDSDLSMAGDIRSSKTNLKGKLSGMFRRAGSSSRANSTEALDRELQRPVAIQTLGNGPTAGLAPGQGHPPRPVSASTPHLARQAGKPPTPSMAPTQRRRVVATSQPGGPSNSGTLPK